MMPHPERFVLGGTGSWGEGGGVGGKGLGGGGKGGKGEGEGELGVWARLFQSARAWVG